VEKSISTLPAENEDARPAVTERRVFYATQGICSRLSIEPIYFAYLDYTLLSPVWAVRTVPEGMTANRPASGEGRAVLEGTT
jgi:hypothetical protein